MTMQAKRSFTMALLLAAGCGPYTAQSPNVDGDVQPLRALPDIDIQRCRAPDCGAALDAQPAKASPETLAPGTPRAIKTTRASEFTDLCVIAPDLFGGPGECGGGGWDNDAMDFASDGAVWFAPTLGTPERDGQVRGTALAKFDARSGRMLHQELLDFETTNIGEISEFSAHLAIDSDDHTFVLVGKSVIRELDVHATVDSRLYEFDADGERVGEPLTLSTPEGGWFFAAPQKLRRAGSGRLLIAPQGFGGNGGSVAVLDTDERTLVWARPLPASVAMFDAAAHPDGSVSVIVSEIDPIGGWEPTPYTLQHFAADGAAAWARTLPAPWDTSMSAQLVSDGDGKLYVIGSGGAGPVSASEFYVQKFDAEGSSEWLVKVPLNNANSNGAPGFQFGGLPGLDGDGNLWVMGESYYEEIPADTPPDQIPEDLMYGTIAYRLSTDGERCDSFDIQRASPQRLAFRDGKFYFFDGGFGTLQP